MSSRAIAESYFRALDAGDVEAALRCFAPGAEFVSPLGPLPFPDGVRAYLQGFDVSFPGARVTITNAVEAGDQVAIEALWVGKQTGPLPLPDGRTLAPTGREARAPFAGLFRVRDGRIVAHRAYWDLAGFLAQLQPAA
jgi:ketosteroid isomerase-like protein